MVVISAKPRQQVPASHFLSAVEDVTLPASTGGGAFVIQSNQNPI